MHKYFSYFKLFIPVTILCIALFGVTACGVAQSSKEDTQPSKEELAASAEEINWDSIVTERIKNKAKVTKEYGEKLVKVSATVRQIEEDHCVVSHKLLKGLPYNPLDIYLPEDVLAELEVDQYCTFVGTFDENAYDILDAFIVEE